jgi:hypothetical protein
VYVEYIWTEHAFDLMYPPLANPAAKAALYDLERFLVVVANTPSRAGTAGGAADPGGACR